MGNPAPVPTVTCCPLCNTGLRADVLHMSWEGKPERAEYDVEINCVCDSGQGLEYLRVYCPVHMILFAV